MLKPLGSRIVVKLLPRYAGEESKLNLVLIDGQKHYQGVRRGTVEAVSGKVLSIGVGDVVVFSGDHGDSFGMNEGGANDGTEYRRLSVGDVLGVEEMVSVEAA